MQTQQTYISEYVKFRPANGMYNEITSDAWGRQKVVNDYSVFHGLFTYDIPSQLWLTYHNGVEQTTSTRVTSVDGGASIKSGATLGNTAFLRSKRHPRYQPNRGHLFSTAGFLPNPTATGIRQLGLKNTITGVYFQLENGVLYAVVLNDSTEKIKQALDLSVVGLTINDLAYGHLYDIQFQWRGVGDYFFYIDQKLIFKTSFLGTNTELTVFNPAISVGFYSENTDGTEVEIIIGCVDITSEGGVREGVIYTSVANTAVRTVSTANYPVLSVFIKNTFNSLPNSRDVLALRCTGSSDQRSYMRAWITRTAGVLTGASFQSITSSCVEYDVSATALATASCKLLWSKRIEANSSGFVDLPHDLIDFYLSGGDYLIITMERDSPTQVANVEVTLEMGEEI